MLREGVPDTACCPSPPYEVRRSNDKQPEACPTFADQAAIAIERADVEEIQGERNDSGGGEPE